MHGAIWLLLPSRRGGMVYFPCWLMLLRLCVFPVLDSFLCFFGIRTISSDVPLVLPKEEAVLPSGLLVLIHVLVFALVVSSGFLLVVRVVALVFFLLLRMLLVAFLIYIKDLLVMPSLWLIVISVIPWGFALALSLLVLTLLFQSSTKVTVESAVFF